VTSGIRLGTAAITTRGLKENEMKLIAKWINQVITNSNDENILQKVKNEIHDLMKQFPLPYTRP
jgi:glycine hydroxymethyltransferase